MMMEAAQRYSDTSWQIHRESKKRSATPQPNGSAHIQDVSIKPGFVKSNSLPNGITPINTSNQKSQPRQIVQIETVETAYEPVKNKVELKKVDLPRTRSLVQIEVIETTYQPLGNTPEPQNNKSEIILLQNQEKRFQNVSSESETIDACTSSETDTICDDFIDRESEAQLKKVDIPRTRSLVQIEVIETTYEPLGSTPEPQNSNSELTVNQEKRLQDVKSQIVDIDTTSETDTICDDFVTDESEVQVNQEKRLQDVESQIVDTDTTSETDTICDDFVTNESEVQVEKVDLPRTRSFVQLEIRETTFEPLGKAVELQNTKSDLIAHQAKQRQNVSSERQIVDIDTTSDVYSRRNEFAKKDVQLRNNNNADTRREVEIETVETSYEPVNNIRKPPSGKCDTIPARFDKPVRQSMIEFGNTEKSWSLDSHKKRPYSFCDSYAKQKEQPEKLQIERQIDTVETTYETLKNKSNGSARSKVEVELPENYKSHIMVELGNVENKYLLDTPKKQCLEKSWSLDSHEKGSLRRSGSLDTHKTKKFDKSESLDIHNKRSLENNWSLNALKNRNLEKSWSLDSHEKQSMGKSGSLDTHRKQCLERSESSDTQNKGSLEKSWSLRRNKKRSLEKSWSLDRNKKRCFEQRWSLDSHNKRPYSFCELYVHTHDDQLKNGSLNKMLTSSSYNGFGEALTSQPRSTRNNSNSATNMDLSYVTERIISMWFPPSTTQHAYRQGQRQASHMLRNKHGDNYMVFNLSEPKRALRTEHKHVKEVGWAHNLAPPLEKLCSVCKEIDSWLSGDQHRIAVLHARASKDKLGVIVAAYMHYSNICGNAEQALDRFSMRKFLDDNVGPLTLPSNKRYVDYFAGLLSHNIKIKTAPLYLTHVTVLGAPAFQSGGCKAFLKLYEGHTALYTSGVYNVTSGVSQFTVNVAGERRRGLQLRGDILIKCYHRGDVGRETIFACQFHTCAVADYTLSFTRQELDFACNDPRFPADGAIELHFSPGPEIRHPAPAPTPAVPFTLTDDPITRADSPLLVEESDEDADSDSDDVNHTFGPLDGSIYATIAKKPELSPGAVSSPLTVSMDSGISSAGHQQNANTNASASPPLTAQPSPLTPEEQHRQLDKLLSDMLLTVESIPDPKPHQDHQQQSTTNHFSLDNVRYIDEEEDKNIPYHARQDSRPFSYGVNSTMIEQSKGLSSPSLVRKASVNRSTGDTLKKVQTQVYPDFSKPVPNFPSYNSSSNYNTLSSKYGTYSSSPGREKDPIDDIFTSSALSANQPSKRDFREAYYREDVKRYDPLKRSYTEGTLRRSPEKITDYKTSSSVVTSPYSDTESLSPPGAFRSATKSPEFHETYTNNNLTWLQRQQLKLKERREIQLREERLPHEFRLMSELRNVQSRHMRPTASHRLDGYTSDTTAFADDDDDYTIPLHINTMNKNNNVGSRSYSTTKTMYSTTKNERPFMAVKRAHENYAQSSDSSPASILAANPLGQIVRSPSRGGDTIDSGLLSLVEQEQQYTKCQSPRYNNTSGSLYREDSHWRSQSVDVETSPSHSSSPRPQTPAFPVHARTPYMNASTPTVQFDLPSERLPPKSPTTQRKDRPISPTDLTNGTSEYIHSVTQRSVSATPPAGYRDFSENYQHSPKSPSHNGSSSPTVYFGNSRRSSVHSNSEPLHEVSPVHVKFVRDTSSYWYKPTITREEAISMLRDQPPGTFVVRNSNSFQGAFGMALKVAILPSNVRSKTYNPDDLVRHFLIEPTAGGVRLKGCQNEPVFSSLSALVYQHSVTPIALPCRLLLPEGDLKTSNVSSPAQQALNQGAACNVLYLQTYDMESLTGPQAIRKAVLQALQDMPPPDSIIVHFKVNGQGITLTDNKRKLFFRRHYPINTISHCGLDPDEHRWSVDEEKGLPKSSNRIFGFVARKPGVNNPDNQCHLFAEIEPEQPATAIVNFVNKVLTSSGIKPNIV